MNLSDILFHLGENRDEYFNAVTPPIITSSNFCFKTTAEMKAAIANEFDVPIYSRGNNPTVEMLRKKMAALEQTEDALLFGSGSAAIAAAIMPFVKQGDHILCVQKPYSWTTKLLQGILEPYGVSHTFAEATDSASFLSKIQPNTTFIYLESPNSFSFELQDLKAICTEAKKRGIMTLVDNSYSTPLYQQPALFGADLIAHSATKYISGHSDAVAGVVCGSSEHIRHIFKTTYMTLGAIAAPQVAWLLLRGLRTLPLRLERSSSSAMLVAQMLEKHPKVKAVNYPFLPSFPQYELAKSQMKGCGGMLSVELKVSSPTQVEQFCDHLKYFLLAVSWGGYESLAIPAIATYGEPMGLVRLYVGLEEPELLLEDLQQALEFV